MLKTLNLHFDLHLRCLKEWFIDRVHTASEHEVLPYQKSKLISNLLKVRENKIFSPLVRKKLNKEKTCDLKAFSTFYTIASEIEIPHHCLPQHKKTSEKADIPQYLIKDISLVDAATPHSNAVLMCISRCLQKFPCVLLCHHLWQHMSRYPIGAFHEHCNIVHYHPIVPTCGKQIPSLPMTLWTLFSL